MRRKQLPQGVFILNRLNLNFKIRTNKERAEFIQEYLNQEMFQKRPPNEYELETIANYILYGHDEDGKNVVQKKEIQIATKNGTWDRKEEESLDALIESPTFNEGSLNQVDVKAPTKVKREVFSRAEARLIPELAELLEPIWRIIDELDLTLNFYDLAHDKRKNPPREELLNRFTEKEISNLKEKSTHLNPYSYLKKRHLLVEYRREQFTIRDSFKAPIPHLNQQYVQIPTDPIEIDSEIPVFPFGLSTENEISKLLFQPFSKLNPKNFSPSELKEISRFIWMKQEEENSIRNSDLYFTFENLEHIYNLYLSYYEIEDSFQEDEENFLLKTLEYYTEETKLDEVQKEILYLKIKKVRNQDVAQFINQKYNKSYTANYISTIFRQKILLKISSTAAYHRKIIQNLFFEENFKQCNTCKEIFLIDEENFVHKSRALDGFSNRCKRCDKAERQRKKN